MATLAFGLIGAAAGPSLFGATAFTLFGNAVTGAALGGFIFSSIGSLVDNFILMPALFPPPRQTGPKLEELQYAGASEGTEATWAYGSHLRVPCPIIWEPMDPEDSTKVKFEQVEVDQGGKGGGPSQTSFKYYLNLAAEITTTDEFGNVRRVKRIMAGSKVLWDGQPNLELCDDVVVYDGSQTTVDPLIESVEGVGNAPAYMDVSYFVVHRLYLDPFGRTTPPLYAVFTTGERLMLDDVVSVVLARAGFDPSEFDVSLLQGICFKGVITQGPQPTLAILQPILQAYAVNVQESEGVLRFVPRGMEEAIRVEQSDLAAGDAQGSPPRTPMLVVDVNDVGLPGQATVRFYNSDDATVQRGSEPYARADWSGREQQVTLDVPLVLSTSEGHALAQRIVTTAEEERQSASAPLMPNLWTLQAGDAVLVDWQGEERRVYLPQVDRGANGVVEVRGFFSEVSAYENDGVRGPVASIPPRNLSRTTQFTAVNSPPLLAEAANLLCLYAAGEAQGTLVGRLHGTTEDWETDASVTRAGVVGQVSTPPTIGPVGLWDYSSSMIVRLHGSATLSPATEQEVLDGANRIVVEHPSGDSEVIGFASVAEGPDDGEWTLSTLLRGLLATEHLVDGGMLPGARFFLAKGDGSVTVSELGLGEDRDMRLARPGQPATLANPTLRAACNGQSARPASPSHVELSEDPGTGDMTVSWQRRSRVPQRSLARGPLAADEGSGSYRVELHLYTPNSPARITEGVVGAESITISAADLSAAGLSGSGLRARVYMVGTTVGDSVPGRGEA